MQLAMRSANGRMHKIGLSLRVGGGRGGHVCTNILKLKTNTQGKHTRKIRHVLRVRAPDCN